MSRRITLHEVSNVVGFVTVLVMEVCRRGPETVNASGRCARRSAGGVIHAWVPRAHACVGVQETEW